MKKRVKITILLVALGTAALTMYTIRRGNSRRMLAQVANEGYETAPDILFPDKRVSNKLHFGPVLPNN